jgi:glycosyltransferase involved in cell wall biosynthesis
MPTADRRAYVGQAIAAFLSQDYENRELVIIDDGIDGIEDLVPSDERIHYVRRARGQSLGAKRNEACRLAHGEIIVHWDDDDWHAPWRLSYQVGTLVAEQADICGLDRLWFFDPENKRAWQYRYHGRPRWLAGGTFCYRKSVWQRHPFANVSAGEDTRFVREAPFRKVLALTRDDFYVARIHARNTCRKQTGAPSWFAVPREHVERLIEQGRASSLDVLPLVSCIMPTADRGPFVELALGRFAEQDYVNKELIIVDDGVLPVQALAYGRPGVRYLRLPARQTIGEKRNLACSLARGEYIVQWDDDDWYGPLRLAHQVAPLQAGEADITGLRCRWLATLPDGGFWQMTAALHRRMFVHDVHGGTLAWRKRLWDEGLRYPAANLAEDAALLREAVRRGARLQVLENRGDFVYCRHGANAWNFVAGQAVDPRQWLRIERPPQLAEATFASYRAALDAQHSMHERPSA